jgi:hypothetical protein
VLFLLATYGGQRKLRASSSIEQELWIICLLMSYWMCGY